MLLAVLLECFVLGYRDQLLRPLLYLAGMYRFGCYTLYLCLPSGFGRTGWTVFPKLASSMRVCVYQYSSAFLHSQRDEYAHSVERVFPLPPAQEQWR